MSGDLDLGRDSSLYAGHVLTVISQAAILLVSMAGHGPLPQVKILSMLPWKYWQLEMPARHLCQCLQPLLQLL